MTAVIGRAAGFIGNLYYVPTVIATKSESTVEAAAVTANSIIDAASAGTLDKARTIIDIPVYGADVAGKLPGQADPGTFDFNVTLNLDNTVHKALRDDDGRNQHTFIVEFNQSTAAKTYAVFDGFIAGANVGFPIDDRIQMDVSIARSGAITWIDNT